MGSEGLPKIFVDNEAELPSASKWNDNFSFLNYNPRNLIRNGDFENGFFVQGASNVPNQWTLSGPAALSAQSGDTKKGDTAVQLTFGSSTAILTSTILSGTETKYYQGKKVRIWCWIKSSFPNVARCQISDGVAATVTPFHTGSGNYEFLEIEHEVAVTATGLKVELRIEAAGSAIFDVCVLVDHSENRRWLDNAEDLKVGATREIFFEPPDPSSALGFYAVQNVASAQTISIAFKVPHDFTTITSAALVLVNSTTSGPQTVELSSNYAANIEDATATQEQNPTAQFSYVANLMAEFTLTTVLTGIAAGDYVGVLLDRQSAGFGTWSVIGFRLRYS